MLHLALFILLSSVGIANLLYNNNFWMELSVIQGIMQIKQGVMVFANNTLQYLLGFFSSFD